MPRLRYYLYLPGITTVSFLIYLVFATNIVLPTTLTYTIFVAWLTSIFISLLIWLYSIRTWLRNARVLLVSMGLFIAGIPFALMFGGLFPRPFNAPILAITLFLGGWAFLSGLLTRHARGIYWSWHIAAWTIGIGLARFEYIAGITYGLPLYSTHVSWGLWLLLPAGISLALGAQYKEIIHTLGCVPLIQPVESAQKQKVDFSREKLEMPEVM